MNLLVLGFRRVPSSGVLIQTAPLSPRGATPSVVGTDDRVRRTADIRAVHDRLAAGWYPDNEDLHGSPILNGWQLLVLPDGVALIGTVTGHPCIRDGRRAVTSPVIAIDERLLGWVRTCSRFYRLGRSVDATLSS